MALTVGFCPSDLILSAVANTCSRVTVASRPMFSSLLRYVIVVTLSLLRYDVTLSVPVDRRPPPSLSLFCKAFGLSGSPDAALESGGRKLFRGESVANNIFFFLGEPFAQGFGTESDPPIGPLGCFEERRGGFRGLTEVFLECEWGDSQDFRHLGESEKGFYHFSILSVRIMQHLRYFFTGTNTSITLPSRQIVRG